MYDRHLITNKDKCNYYNKIYLPLHPCYDEKTRVYTRTAQDCDFEFRDGELIYTKTKDLDLSQSDKIFKSFFDLKKEQTIQEQISFYLNNNIVPGFSHTNYDANKKEVRFQSKDITNPESYITDKTFNVKKDDLTIYNEKFFQEKEIEKKRKANQNERAKAGIK